MTSRRSSPLRPSGDDVARDPRGPVGATGTTAVGGPTGLTGPRGAAPGETAGPIGGDGSRRGDAPTPGMSGGMWEKYRRHGHRTPRTHRVRSDQGLDQRCLVIHAAVSADLVEPPIGPPVAIERDPSTGRTVLVQPKLADLGWSRDEVNEPEGGDGLDGSGPENQREGALQRVPIRRTIGGEDV